MRMLHSIYDKANRGVYKDITIKFITVLVEMLLVSIFIWIVLWDKNRDLIHSILGIVSVCIGVATFLIIIIQANRSHNSNGLFICCLHKKYK